MTSFPYTILRRPLYVFFDYARGLRRALTACVELLKCTCTLCFQEHEIPTSDVKAKLKLKLISASNLAKMDLMGALKYVAMRMQHFMNILHVIRKIEQVFDNPAKIVLAMWYRKVKTETSTSQQRCRMKKRSWVT